MKKICKGTLITTFLLVFALAVTAVRTTPVEAATKKVTAKTSVKKAPAVKKGTTNVTIKKNGDYTKFTAPKAGTYKIEISNIQTTGKNEDSQLGSFVICKLSGAYPIGQTVSTNGGKATYLSVATKVGQANQEKYNNQKKKKLVERYLAKRYGKIKLKKGETVYLKLLYTSEKKHSYTLKIS